MVISTTPEKLQQVNDQIGPNADVHSIPFIYINNMKVRLKNVVIKTNKVGGSNSFIFGHPVNGVLGVANGLGGSQIVLGDTTGSVTQEFLRRSYIWNGQGEFDKGTKSANVDTSQGFLQLGNVTVKNISLEHKTK